MDKRPHIVPAIIATVMLLVAIAPLPYGYYQFLRWAVCGVSIFIAVKSYYWKQSWATWLFGAIAVLFNPVLPIELSKEVWFSLDIICSILFVLSVLCLPVPVSFLKKIKKIWNELGPWWRKTAVLSLLLLVLVYIVLGLAIVAVFWR